VIVEVALDDGLSVAVVEDGAAEDLAGMQRRRCRQRHFHGVEIIEDLAIGRLVVIQVSEADIGFAQLRIQRIAAMGLIDDDAIKRARRRALGRVRLVEDAGDQRLHGRHLYLVLVLRDLRLRACHLVDLGEVQQALDLGRLQRVTRLLAERPAIHEEEDAGFRGLGRARPATAFLGRQGAAGPRLEGRPVRHSPVADYRGNVAVELARAQINRRGIVAGAHAREKTKNAGRGGVGQQNGTGNLGRADEECRLSRSGVGYGCMTQMQHPTIRR
jgi:hypothetical protein